MEYRKLGGDIESVSTICLGTMTFGNPVAEPDAVRLVHWALDQGINFIDTANIYEGYARVPGSPGGVAEEILGKALRGRRDQIVLVSKVGNAVGPGPGDQGLGRAHVLREVDKSLRRLRTDRIDLYYLHRPDPETPLDETLCVFNELVDQGKVRAIGCSNYSAAQMEEILRICDRHGFRRPLAVQPPYSLLRRDIEADLLPLCLREGLAVTPYQVLQGGLLTGKYQRGSQAPTGSRKSEHSSWVWDLTDDIYTELERIAVEAHTAGRSMMQHAIAWTLAQSGVVSVVLGVKHIAQLNDAIASTGCLGKSAKND